MTQLIVQEMTCGGCASAVTKAVQRIDASAKVDVNLETKQVEVESNGDINKIIAAIEDAGFPASLA